MRETAAILTLLLLLASCRTKRTVETYDGEWMHYAEARRLETETDWRLREMTRTVSWYEADSTGRLREVRRMVEMETETDSAGRKIENEAQIIDSASVSAKNDITISKTKETPSEGRKKGSWRWFVLGIAATVAAVVYLWLKINMTWIRKD